MIECNKCDGCGYIFYEDEKGYSRVKECGCMAQRKALERLQVSGLDGVIQQYTFDNFTQKTEWHNQMFTKSQKFLKAKGKLFFAGGAVGSGKTHICTAILGELLKIKSIKYVVWNELVTQLKQDTYGNESKYYKVMEELQNVDVLYIDDFLKIEPTKSDLDKAFQIINTRYNSSKNKDIITLISSEKYSDDIIKIDEAIGSRIVEMAGEFLLNIDKNGNKNMRLNKEK